MCCENNVLKGIIVALALVFIIVLILIIVNNGANNGGSKNILVAVAEPGDNTTLGTTDIKRCISPIARMVRLELDQYDYL